MSGRFLLEGFGSATILGGSLHLDATFGGTLAPF